MTKIVFFGTGPVAAASLTSIAQHFDIESVITKASPPHHKGTAPVEDVTAALSLPVLFANTRQELDKLFENKSFESKIGIIVDHGVIISQKVIDYFPLGIVNSHFSLLPQWRGADPISYSLLSGQPKTGVSLMIIEPTLDTGKLITQKVLAITSDDTLPSLTDKLVTLSNNLIREYLPRYINGEIKPKNQPHPDRATYSSKLSKEDGVIDWHKDAETIEREIRAYLGWPQSRSKLGDTDVIITKASVAVMEPATPGQLKVEKNRLFIGTGTNWLEIKSLKPAGKKEMPVQAFLAGYRTKLSA